MSSIITAGDATNGVSLTAGSNGVLTLQSGLAGAKVNAAVAAADGTLTFLRMPLTTAVASMVRLNTANGKGSTSTAIRRFSTVVSNQGTAITYADSATLGAVFTINTNGVYAIAYVDHFSNFQVMGISLNSSQLTTDISIITAADALVMSDIAGASFRAAVATTVYLPAGSVIRPHNGAVASGGSPLANASFTITRVA